MGACETMSCLFGGKCVIQGKQRVSTELCICSFMCENTRIPVCGTDGKIYMNECFMARASCNKQTPIDEISMDLCDEQSESFCDGFAALMKDNEVITCSNDELKSSCPHYAYCHVIEDEGRCCQGYHYVSKCETSKFGCCPDNQTSALGPAFQGCENNSSCQCSNIGSVSQECDKYTKKCKCKENVEGQQCDRCENNYWGFLKLLENKNSCTACDCDPLGSTRADCDQMTGKCVCLKGVIGHKCNYCIDGSPVSEKGCFEVFDLNLGNTNLIPLPTKASTPVHALTSYPSVSTHRTFSPTDDITSSDFIKPYFNGDSFLQLMPFTHGSKELNIKIQIRSLHHEGIMFFMGALDSSHQIEGYSTARGYALLSFRNGSLEFKYDLGTGSTTLRSQVPLKTNHPYTITAQRRGRDGLLIIDEHTKVTGVSGGRSKFLDASNSIYIGALPSHFTKNRKSGRWRQGFVGCVNSLSLYSGTFSHHYDLSSASADVISTRKIRDCDEVCADYSCLRDPQCSPKADFICKCPPRIYGRYCEKFENDNRYYNDIFYNNRLDDYNSYSSKYHLYNNNY